MTNKPVVKVALAVGRNAHCKTFHSSNCVRFTFVCKMVKICTTLYLHLYTVYMCVYVYQDLMWCRICKRKVGSCEVAVENSSTECIIILFFNL